MTTHPTQIGWGECQQCEEGPGMVIGTQDDEPVFLCAGCYEQVWLETLRIDAEEEI